MEPREMILNIKKVGFVIAGVIIGIICLFNMFEDVDSGEVVVIQYPSGELNVVATSGPALQLFGKVTHYKRSSQFWFNKAEDKEDDQSIKIRFNDGGHANISGSIRWNMPPNSGDVIRLHKDFQNQANIEQQLIKQTITKAVYMTGPVMSSQESYAAKRNDLLTYIEDQAAAGVYRTWSHDVKTKDDFSGAEKTVTVVSIVEKNGKQLRQEISPVKKYNIGLSGLSINSIDYDGTVEKQIQTQQASIMQIQTAMANSKRAEQEAITTELQGKASAAKAKWDQEVIKAKLVTEAQSRNAVALLDVNTADLRKKKDILEGEGIATKKRLIMQADGALDQKLQVYKETQRYWADAFANYSGSLVPQFISGGSAGSGNAAFNFMEMMSAKAMKDLSLDLKNKN